MRLTTSPHHKQARVRVRFTAVCSIIGSCLFSLPVHALPFNQDMVGNQLGLGAMHRPQAPGAVPIGSSNRYVEGDREGAASVLNPISASADSISAGHRLFDAQCSPCHGKIVDSSYVVGAVATYLPGPNLFLDAYKQKADGHFFQFIRYGGMAIMPAYGSKFSIKEHWDIVNYIRSVQASGIGSR
jgi:mono/diheme cytochrome c family protein